MVLHLANKNFVVHFDDDDLYAPQYIEWVVNNMVKRDLGVLTLSSWYNCNLHDGTFPDLSLSEDYMFMCRLQANLGREKVGLLRDRLGMCMRTRFKKSCRDMYKRTEFKKSRRDMYKCTRFNKCRRDIYKGAKFKKFRHALYKRTRFKKSRRDMYKPTKLKRSRRYMDKCTKFKKCRNM